MTLEQVLQLAIVVHSSHDIAATDELALDVKLRESGPLRVDLREVYIQNSNDINKPEREVNNFKLVAYLSTLSDGRIFKNINGAEISTSGLQDAHGLATEAALGAVGGS